MFENLFLRTFPSEVRPIKFLPLLTKVTPISFSKDLSFIDRAG